MSSSLLASNLLTKKARAKANIYLYQHTLYYSLLIAFCMLVSVASSSRVIDGGKTAAIRTTPPQLHILKADVIMEDKY